MNNGELPNEEVLRQRVSQSVTNHFEAREAQTGTEVMRHFEKALMLNVLDQQWKDHLGSMDYLRQGIHLRGYAQRQPMQEYKREAFEMFTAMLENVQHEVVRILARVQVRAEEDVEAVDPGRRADTPMEFQHEEARSATGNQPAAAPDQPYVREGRKVGRNEPCPCGSGKKYKQCHGALS
jgi:preprotein translocase subunit SecA